MKGGVSGQLHNEDLVYLVSTNEEDPAMVAKSHIHESLDHMFLINKRAIARLEPVKRVLANAVRS